MKDSVPLRYLTNDYNFQISTKSQISKQRFTRAVKKKKLNGRLRLGVHLSLFSVYHKYFKLKATYWNVATQDCQHEVSRQW